MSERTPPDDQQDDQQDEPIGDPRPADTDGLAFPPPETPQPTKTANERAPVPADAPAENSGGDAPGAHA